MPQDNGSARPSSLKKVKIAQFGLGPIGVAALRLAAGQPWVEVVGGIDIDPRKVGRPLGELADVAISPEVRVHSSFEELWAEAKPDVVLHTAGSRASISIAQMMPMVRHGVSVASTCEEMLYPRLTASDTADELDRLGRETGARMVATGVNPGFVLDVLPVCLTGVCRRVDGIHGERVVNASTRREPLQRKIGSGMDPELFRELFRQGKAGHAGFRESLALIAHALGWTIGPIEETCEPVVAERAIETRYFEVPRGRTCGLHQRVWANDERGRRIEMDLKMYLDAPDPHDRVRIDGEPPVEAVFPGGIAGDGATVAALINVVPRLLASAPGLRLMTELAVPACAVQSAQAEQFSRSAAISPAVARSAAD